jgi:uncharacterized protein YwgA
VGSAEKGLTPREAALLVLNFLGGTLQGRTAMQKMAYFVSVALETDLGHRAHYYGPYSRPVDYALAQTALSDEVTETMERFPSYVSGPDIRKYTYGLTAEGVKEVTEIQRRDDQAAGIVKGTVKAVQEAVPDLDQQTLSMAAKIHFIVTHQDEPARLEDIPNLAKQLGWRISDAQVERSVQLLQRLDLLTVS